MQFSLKLFGAFMLAVGVAASSPALAATTSTSPTMQRTWGVEDGSWSTARNAADGQYTYTGSIGYTVARYGNGSLYAVYRDFQIFNTSMIGGGTVTSGTYAFYVTEVDTDDSRQYALYAVNGDQTAIATSSYSGCGTVPLSGYFSSDDLSPNNYYAVALNGTGVSYINTTGTTQFCIRDATKDVANVSPPGPDAQSHIQFAGYTAGNPPILTLAFDPLVPFTVVQGGTGAGSFTLNGVLLGNGTNPIQATSAGSANQVFRVPGGGGAPSFGAIDLSESAAVTGILSFGFGGTGATTTFTAGSVIFAGDGRFKQNNANFFWDDTAQRLGLGTSSPTVRLEVNGTGAMNHFKGRGGAPSVASGTCAGTGGAVSLTGTDAAGTVTLDTGSATPSSSVCFTVTFVTAYATAPHVIFSASNAAAAGLSGAKQVYSSSTASTFTFTVGSTSLSNSTTYKWSYYVVE